MTALSIALPDETGRSVAYRLEAAPIEAPAGPYRFNRSAYAAAHVVADPLAVQEPGLGPAGHPGLTRGGAVPLGVGGKAAASPGG